jgi:hypothetical protein
MATRAVQLTPLIVKFVAATRAPAPVFTLDLTRIGASIPHGIRQRARILVRVGSHCKLIGQLTPKNKECDPLLGRSKPQHFVSLPSFGGSSDARSVIIVGPIHGSSVNPAYQ